MEKIVHLVRENVSKLAQNQTLIFFSKMALTIFLVFGLKLVLNMTFNLNETYFAIWRYFTLKLSKFSCFLTIHRSRQRILVLILVFMFIILFNTSYTKIIYFSTSFNNSFNISFYLLNLS